MKQLPSVTVLVVSYNHSRFVEECLDSIRNQNWPNLKVIIGDDNSPDDTATKICAYLAKYPELGEFYPNTKNIGLNRTLNSLLRHVDSDYVTYISADDFMLPGRIKSHVALMENGNHALAYSDAIVVNENSAILHETSRTEFPWPEEPTRSSSPFACLLTDNWIPAASIFLSTDALRSSGGYREDLFYEDYELLVRLAKDYTFTYTAEPSVAVRRLSSSLGATGFRHNNPEFIYAMDQILRHYEGAEEPLAHKAISRRWELAKRAARIYPSKKDAFELMIDARKGASSPIAIAKHFALLLLRRK